MQLSSSEREVRGVDDVDLGDATVVDLRRATLSELGYKSDWSYLPKEALNSLFAYLDGEFAYPREDREQFTRQDLLLMLGHEIGDVEVENKLDKGQLEKVVKLLRENDDQRDWV